MDRADCQLVMLGFSTLYYNSFIAPKIPSVDKMLYLASLMTLSQQKRLVEEVSIKALNFVCKRRLSLIFPFASLPADEADLGRCHLLMADNNEGN